MTQIKRKTAVFGLDGLTFDLLQPWLDKGHMPNLAKLLREGANGRLRSTIPPVSASAWASFATGCNPGQHGLVDFTYPAADGYAVNVSNGRTRSAPALWEIVGQARGQVGVVSLPMTYPPQPVNGFMVCSFLTPDSNSRFTHPDALQEEIATTVGNFPLQMSENGRGRNPRRFIRSCKQMEIDRAQTVKHLLQNKPWDLFIYVFETTDNLQHEMWHLLDKNHPRYDALQAADLLPEVLDYYNTVDHLLGEMMALVPDDALVVALSDHGFGPFHKFFHVNNWLAAHGWLKFKRTPLTLLKRAAFKLGITPLNALKWVMAFRLSYLRKNVKRGRGDRFLRLLFLSFHDVDWARTKAFSVGNFGQVYLNVQGKRPSAPVTPADYETLRDEIAKAALELHDPVDGRVIQHVYKREEIFHGHRLEQLPDLILHTDRAQFVSFGHADFGSNQVLEPSIGQTGHHHMIGILGLKGPGIQPALTLQNASLMDVAPTILHYMGLPVPDHMDGQILTAAFTNDFNAANPIQFTPTNFTGGQEPPSASSLEETDLILEKLRRMGYVA